MRMLTENVIERQLGGLAPRPLHTARSVDDVVQRRVGDQVEEVLGFRRDDTADGDAL